MKKLQLPWGKRKGLPGWVEEQGASEDVWAAVRNPDLAATRQARWARVLLVAMLLTWPAALISCVGLFSARGDANTALAIAEDAMREVEAIDRAQTDTVLRPEAIAAVRGRLYATGHPFQRVLIEDKTDITVDVGEEHQIVLIDLDGQVILEARTVLDSDSGQLIGVTFLGAALPAASEDLVPDVIFLPSLYTNEEAQRGLDQTFGPPGEDGIRAGFTRFGYLQEDAYATLAAPGLTLGDFYTDNVVASPQGLISRAERWLTAWATNDQEVLRELGDYTEGEIIPWFGASGYGYVHGSIVPLATVLFQLGEEDLLVTHIRFALADASGTVLFQDLELDLQQDGQILRILGGSPLGEVIDE